VSSIDWNDTNRHSVSASGETEPSSASSLLPDTESSEAVDRIPPVLISGSSGLPPPNSNSPDKSTTVAIIKPVAQNDGIWNFVAFVADSDEVEISLACRAELNLNRLTCVGADGPAHTEEYRAGAAIRLLDDDRGVSTAGAGNAEFALHHRLAWMLRTRDVPGCVELTLASA
jgi:hypothetical protein